METHMVAHVLRISRYYRVESFTQSSGKRVGDRVRALSGKTYATHTLSPGTNRDVARSKPIYIFHPAPPNSLYADANRDRVKRNTFFLRAK